MPEPVLVSALAPLITPPSVSWVPLTSMAVPAPSVTAPPSTPEPLLLASVPLRVRASVPMVWPLTSSVAPVATVVAPTVLPSAAAWPVFTVPPLMVVAPS